MKLRPFELALAVFFIVLGALSLILLATYSSKPNEDEFVVGAVQIWGTLDEAKMNSVLHQLVEENEAYIDVQYFYVQPEVFSSKLVNAIADGSGPDLILTSHEQLVELRRRITPISYESFPVRDIRSMYVDGAEIFALSDGLYAYPVAVDPLMLYWNRDMLTTKNLINPPATWESLVNTYAPNLTERDFERTIVKSAVALGEYGNVRNAFGIISALLLQGGSRGVLEQEGNYVIRLNEAEGGGRPLTSVADFYTRFSRPNNTLYSWNRSLNEDRQRFVSEDLALYFGFGSEGREIERLNPNLNFDIAQIPQGASATVRRTYGAFYGLSLVRTADNVRGAAVVLRVLSSASVAARIAVANDLAPVHRELIAQGSNDTYGRYIYQSAAIAYGWLSPSRAAIDGIFSTMVRDVTEGRFDESRAAADAVGRLSDSY